MLQEYRMTVRYGSSYAQHTLIVEAYCAREAEEIARSMHSDIIILGPAFPNYQFS